jgi:hypothetical protein
MKPTARRRNLFLTHETRFGRPRHLPETVWDARFRRDRQRSLNMSAIISLIYREYCRARLAEIQKLAG